MRHFPIPEVADATMGVAVLYKTRRKQTTGISVESRKIKMS